MGRGGDRQVWVTSAVTGEEVRGALVLGCSLKRTLSSRRVAVIVGPDVEEKLRNKLYRVFDLVFSVGGHPSGTGLGMEDLAKVTALAALASFYLAVYLSPGVVAVRNADGIFEEGPGGIDMDMGNWGNLILPPDGSLRMFLFRPSVDLYDRIVKAFQKSRNGRLTDLRSLLKTLSGGDFKPGVKLLEGKYTQGLQAGRMLVGNEEDFSLVDLGEVDLIGVEGDLEDYGMIGKFVIKYWRKIYEEDVEALMGGGSSQSVDCYALPKFAKEPIAIVGMSCRLPGSNNLEEFWSLLMAGGDGTSTPPPFRWLSWQSVRSRPECRKTNAGFLKDPVDEFDAKFFGVSPKEAVSMDPQHRLLYELVWEGLEDACINPQDLKGTPGSVFIGCWTNDYRDVLAGSGRGDFYRTYMGNSIGAAAARISHLLELVGPSVATESGCSSGMVAVHLACGSLQQGESNMALACGVNLLMSPFDQDEMPMIVSAEGHCKTFCEKADGFARGEGGGVLVLKRLSDAVRDKDRIWGMIRGSAISQEGISKSMGTPTVHGESLAMTGALRDAGVRPEEVSYVEAHGTGTVVGDPLEVAAIAKAYNSSRREEPLLIGSVKTNVGHTESCSGITGIIKVALAMQHDTIPAHRNFERLNPAIDLEAVPARIPLEPVEWKRSPGKPRRAGVSSFGITGKDAHVIMEEAPKSSMAKVWTVGEDFERPLHLVKLSAKTGEGLQVLLERYREELGRSEEGLKDIAYSSNVGRASFPHRAVLIANSKEQFVAQIQEGKFLRGEVPPKQVGKICFLFPGQGSQYPGMAKQLYETSPTFRMHFDLCDRILRETYATDIKRAMWDKGGRQEINRTIYSQTSIFCVEYALLKLWESWGVQPDYVLGHSLGEFAAAVGAGILTVEDALKLVAERSLLIEQLPGGKMLVVRAPQEQVEKLLIKFGKGLDFAAINSSEQTVVAGDSLVVSEFSRFCTAAGVKSVVLDATHAFHSRHMDSILREYGQIASTVKRGPEERCQFISGLRGGPIPGTGVDAEYWVEHTRDKVKFLEASQQAVKLGCRIFIEVGPQPVLSAFTLLNNDTPLSCLPSLKKTGGDWETILPSLGKLYLEGLPINWEGFHQFQPRKKVRLPSYPFLKKKFWPELMPVGEANIHPLLGSPISNPSPTKLFQCGLNLNAPHEYLREHAIGENVIVPGAAFLEMCLAAGLATVENSVDSLGKPSRPMKVENLSIEAPLQLREGRTTQVQTVVELNTSSNSGDWKDMRVQIFQRVEEEPTTFYWTGMGRCWPT